MWGTDHQERVSLGARGRHRRYFHGGRVGFGTLPCMSSGCRSVRVATAADAPVVADLLDRFNRQYDTPTPGPAVLAARLERLLAGDDVLALLAGEPTVGVALLTLRPNVWSEGPVALLDELYVLPVERRHGLGSALLQAAEEECRRRGGELLEINVDGQDTDARRFYERHGYSNCEPGQREPELYYHRDLVADGPT
jgi:GNAT superfamily N-acetyltransferase